jgi:hypothetical protein
MAAKKKCLIPGCKRRVVARGVCHPTYRKASREGLLSALSASPTSKAHKQAIAQLQLDGRKTRWE